MTDFTVSLPYWAIPTLLTLVVWGVVILWPTEPRRGDYDFSGAFVGLIQLFAGISITLVIWLVYFIIV